MMTNIIVRCCFALALMVTSDAESAVYIEKEDFLTQAFVEVPQSKTIWLDENLKRDISEILGHPYRGLRIRYWRVAQKSSWILDEIGKEQPITVGIVIDGRKVTRVAILAFRESRGWEVKYPFFTDQFTGSELGADGMLSKSIDGISGATLSVRAVTKITRAALYLHKLVISDAI